MQVRKGGVTRPMKANKAECHPDKPLYAKGLCRSCYEKNLRKRNPEYVERQHKNTRNWIQKHSDQKRRTDKLYRARLDPERKWAYTLWSCYKLTPEQYYTMLKQQHGVCAICGKKPTKIKLAVDHCHKTGKIRGLLCFRCNYGLSWFQDNAKLFTKAGQYLK